MDERSAIESLLRDTYRGPLSFAADRAMLPGDVTFAGPLAGADRSSTWNGWAPIHEYLLGGWYYTTSPLEPVVDGRYSMAYLHHWAPESDPVYGPWETSATLAGAFASGAENSFIAKRSGQYTGRMREVVQLLAGRGLPILYEYLWAHTHGVYVNPINQSWWVIDIDRAAGVRAYPLPISGEIGAEDQALYGVSIPCMPSAGPSPGPTRELLSAAGLAPCYAGGSGYYSDHGWAFSYTGTQAQIISIGGGTTWPLARRFVLSLAADSAGDPVSAALSLAESGALWAPRAFAPKFPMVIPGVGSSLLTYDTLTNAVGPTGLILFPLDVFFQPGSETPIVSRLSITAGAATATEAANWPPAGYAMNGVYVADRQTHSGHTGTASITYSDTVTHAFSIGSPVTPLRNRNTTESLWKEQTSISVANTVLAYNGKIAGNSVYSDYYKTTLAAYSYVTHQDISRETLGLLDFQWKHIFLETGI